MKRFPLLATALPASILVLAGCGGANDAGPGSGSDAGSQTKDDGGLAGDDGGPDASTSDASAHGDACSAADGDAGSGADGDAGLGADGDAAVVADFPPQNVDDPRVQQLIAYAKAQVASTSIPGLAFAVVVNGKLFYAGGVGVKKLGGSDPVDAHTLFRAA